VTILEGKAREISLAVLCAAVLGGLLGADALSPSPTVLVWLTGATLLAPIVYRLATSSFDAFEPLVLFVIAWGAMFVIHPAAMIADNDIFYHSPVRNVDLRSTFAGALLLGLAGAVSFLLAYASPLGRSLGAVRRSPPKEVAWDVLISAALVLAAIGLILFMLYLRSIHVGLLQLFSGRTRQIHLATSSSSGYLHQGPYLLIPTSVVLITAGRIRRDRVVSLIGWLLAVLLVARGLALGDRMLLLPLVGGLIILWYMRRDRRPRFLAFIGFIVVALYVTTLIGQLRNADVRAHTSITATAERLVVNPSDVLATVTKSADAAEIRTLSGAMIYVPSRLPYTYGSSTIGNLMARPIPRSVWPSKPGDPTDPVIQLMLPTEFAAGFSNPAATALLPFYRDAGIFGVIVGMFFYGVIARSIYEYYRAWPSSIYAKLLLALSTPLMATAMRDGFTDTVNRAMLIVAPVWVIYRIAASDQIASRIQRRLPRHFGSIPAPDPQDLATR
jgi:hypothetical protein